MTVLKGFAIGILSLLLFLSLSVFGVALMINSTLLNPDFVADELEKMNVSELIIDTAEEQIVEELPEDILFLKEAVYEVISDHEPWLKEQLNNAIYSGYDYLLGKTDDLEITISLEDLKESLRDSLWRVSIKQLPEWLSDSVDDGLKPYIYRHLHEFAENIPKEYLPPEFADLSEEQLKIYVDLYFDDIASQITNKGLLPVFSSPLEALLKPYFEQYYDEFIGDIPSELVIDESEISSDVMEQIVLARQYVSYFRTGYYALIAFMVLLVLGIILIHRNVKDSTRTLGIGFLIYGIIEFASVYVLRNFVPNTLPLDDLPSTLQTWLLGLYGDFLAPLQWFSLGILILGAILLAASFIYRPGEVED